MCSFGCWRPTYERFFLAFSRRHNKLEINQWARQNSRPLIPHERQQNFHPQLERFKNLDPPSVQGSVDQLFGCNHDVKLARICSYLPSGGRAHRCPPFENSNVYPPVIMAIKLQRISLPWWHRKVHPWLTSPGHPRGSCWVWSAQRGPCIAVWRWRSSPDGR